MNEEIIDRATVTMPFMLTWLKKAVVDRCMDVSSDTGVKFREARYFFPLMRTPLTEKELCRLLEVDKANTSRAVVAMLYAGVIKQGRKISGRSFEFELTEKGQEVGTKILTNIYRTIREISADVSDEDMTKFLDIMEKICIASNRNLEMEEIIPELKENVGRKVREDVIPNLRVRPDLPVQENRTGGPVRI